MLSEEQCPPHSRYLYAETRLSPEQIKGWKQDCVKRLVHKNKNAAYEKYMQWTYGAHEAALFTQYAPADFQLPKPFDCIFHINHPEIYVRTPYMLTQSIWEGWFPVDFVEHGHKHLCIFTFPEAVPDIIQSLTPEEQYGNTDDAVRLGLCQFEDLQAIIDRKTKVASLKALYGSNWHEFDHE